MEYNSNIIETVGEEYDRILRENKQHYLNKIYYKPLYKNTGLCDYLESKYEFIFESFTDNCYQENLNINSINRISYKKISSYLNTTNHITLEEKVSAINNDIFLNKYIKAEIVHDNNNDERDYIMLSIPKENMENIIVYYKVLLKHDF